MLCSPPYCLGHDVPYGVEGSDINASSERDIESRDIRVGQTYLLVHSSQWSYLQEWFRKAYSAMP